MSGGEFPSLVENGSQIVEDLSSLVIASFFPFFWVYIQLFQYFNNLHVPEFQFWLLEGPKI